MKNYTEWFMKHKYATVVLVALVLLLVILAVGDISDQPPKSEVAPVYSKAANTSSHTAENKEIADGITIQSTGFSHDNNSGKYRYGLILNNAKTFTGDVDVTFSGTNGTLSNALTFTEQGLKEGAGDVGSVVLKGYYNEYRYKVVINGQTFDYPSQKLGQATP